MAFAFYPGRGKSFLERNKNIQQNYLVRVKGLKRMECGTLRMGQQILQRITRTGIMGQGDMDGLLQSRISSTLRSEKIAFLQRIQGDERETEMEENLQTVDGMLANLRNMAVDMSAEISDQNEQLDRITLKVELECSH